jgi:hypothetical protein
MTGTIYIVETPAPHHNTLVGPIIEGEDDLDGEFILLNLDTDEKYRVKGWLVDIRPYDEA